MRFLFLAYPFPHIFPGWSSTGTFWYDGAFRLQNKKVGYMTALLADYSL